MTIIMQLSLIDQQLIFVAICFAKHTILYSCWYIPYQLDLCQLLCLIIYVAFVLLSTNIDVPDFVNLFHVEVINELYRNFAEYLLYGCYKICMI